MTKNIDIEGLSSIADNYDLFYIDLWGVVHNGITLNEKAIIVLNELLKMKKDFVLLTNAPRPIEPVKIFLEKMGMNEEIREHVFTSGEAALIFRCPCYQAASLHNCILNLGCCCQHFNRINISASCLFE